MQIGDAIWETVWYNNAIPCRGGDDMRPLADEIRPQTLEEVAGQKHLLGEGALLRRIIESGTSTNLIFYGPSLSLIHI